MDPTFIVGIAIEAAIILVALWIQSKRNSDRLNVITNRIEHIDECLDDRCNKLENMLREHDKAVEKRFDNHASRIKGLEVKDEIWHK